MTFGTRKREGLSLRVSLQGSSTLSNVIRFLSSTLPITLPFVGLTLPITLPFVGSTLRIIIHDNE